MPINTLKQSVEIQSAYAFWESVSRPPIRHAPPRALPGDFDGITVRVFPVPFPQPPAEWQVVESSPAGIRVIARCATDVEARLSCLEATLYGLSAETLSVRKV